MTRDIVVGLAAVAISGMSSTALADWTANGELGGSYASGNNENQALNAALGVKKARGK